MLDEVSIFMIPQFPQFKKIELTDKDDVEKFTKKYPPYSDFNFVSMWSWNIQGEMRLSILNENLVVHFTNYLTGKLFYSFLGDKKVDETTSTLINFSMDKGLKPRLYLIPEIVADKLDINKFIIKEDRDNFDYIYDINLISELKGATFSDKRNRVNSFVKKFPNIRIENLDFKNPTTEIDILKLDAEWLKDKIKKDINYKFNINESMAIDSFFKSKLKNIIGVGIYDDKILVGYSIFETLPNGYSICHFCKAKTHFNSIYDYLVKESAKILRSKGFSLLNYEQDLGIPGLRHAKNSFRPINFLKKFTCTNKYRLYTYNHHEKAESVKK